MQGFTLTAITDTEKMKLRRGGSNEYPQSMFWGMEKWGLRGYSIHGHVILMLWDGWVSKFSAMHVLFHLDI